MEIKVEFTNLIENKVSYQFSVRDTGIGITEEQRQRLFKAFTQADGSTTRKFGGTGLGLVISNLLVEKMKSSLQFDSEWGKGSTFHFSIETEYSQQVFSKSPEIVYKKVLVLDSNTNNLKNIAEHLKKWDVDYSLCESSLNALFELQAEKFDLFICNYIIPDIDVLEIISHIRNKFQICSKSMKIALMYQASDEDLVNTELDKGDITHKLIKPVKSDDLLALLSNTKKTIKENELYSSGNYGNCNEVKDSGIITDKKVILIVEDVEMNMMLIKVHVTNILPNVEIIEATNGLEALKVAKTQKLDLILMDVQMPEMDGMEATQNIRKLDVEGAKSLPIIALTAGALKEEKEKALNAGMNDFLTKPIDSEQLKSMLNKYICG